MTSSAPLPGRTDLRSDAFHRRGAPNASCGLTQSLPSLIRRLWLCITAGTLTGCGVDGPPRLVLGTTHTLDDSGLIHVLVRAFKDQHEADLTLSVVVAGSGEVLAMAERGDVDVVLSHAPDAEAALVAAGGALSRRTVMHNTFVVAGPAADPAGVSSARSAADAFRRIAAAAQPFVSRGDDSGTHQAERAVWADARITPSWNGYMEAGTGMADALRLASQRRAYLLTDRATYEVLRDDLELQIVLDTGDELINQYSVLISTEARNRDAAHRFVDWLLAEPTQRLIGEWRATAHGGPFYVPDALPVQPR